MHRARERSCAPVLLSNPTRNRARIRARIRTRVRTRTRIRSTETA